MQWEIKRKIKTKSTKDRREEIVKTVLRNRSLTRSSEIQEFLHPPKPQVLSPTSVGLSEVELIKATERIKKAIKRKEHIVVYGDYDADGICSTAILWETLYSLGASALPFIPHREKHGYGLSIKGINDLRKVPEKPSLIITVDNGIVAHDAVNYANKKGIDIIICDHHEKAPKLPKAYAIIHTTDLAGAGVAWMFAKEIYRKFKKKDSTLYTPGSSLDLATIGTVADMVPLLGANRSIVKHGLKYLRKSTRVGIIELVKEAAVNPEEVEIYQINFVIAPRLNAMGRLEHALDALRLLCTKRRDRAKTLTTMLGTTNRRRQELTQEMLSHAKSISSTLEDNKTQEKILIIDHKDFHEGIIGLIAGKMVEEFYRPTIVLARGSKLSKASARSISGFNIIEAIRESEHFLVDAGGHPMAAGFTIETSKIKSFKTAMYKIANKKITADLLEPKMTLDCEIELRDITWDLQREIEKFEPFGIGNPRPKFALRNCKVVQARTVGRGDKHLKLTLKQDNKIIKGIGFNLGFVSRKLKSGTTIDLATTLDKNIWNGREELQLIIKDIKI